MFDSLLTLRSVSINFRRRKTPPYGLRPSAIYRVITHFKGDKTPYRAGPFEVPFSEFKSVVLDLLRNADLIAYSRARLLFKASVPESSLSLLRRGIIKATVRGSLSRITRLDHV